MPNHRAVRLLAIYPKNIKTTQIKISLIFTVELYTVAKSLNQLNYRTDNGTTKLKYILNGILLSCLKSGTVFFWNKINGPKVILLSEIYQKVKDRY